VEAADYTMKIAHAAMPDSARHKGAEEIKRVVEELTGGKWLFRFILLLSLVVGENKLNHFRWEHLK